MSISLSLKVCRKPWLPVRSRLVRELSKFLSARTGASNPRDSLGLRLDLLVVVPLVVTSDLVEDVVDAVAHLQEVEAMSDLFQLLQLLQLATRRLLLPQSLLRLLRLPPAPRLPPLHERPSRYLRLLRKPPMGFATPRLYWPTRTDHDIAAFYISSISMCQLVDFLHTMPTVDRAEQMLRMNMHTTQDGNGGRHKNVVILA
jgi:hypothetical protein